MSGPNIILEPKLMFQTLQELENETKNILKAMDAMASVLQSVTGLTYAIGFSELIIKAEKDINNFGSMLVAAINAVNVNCSTVVNQLVTKFAPQGAKSSYNAPAFKQIYLTTHVADRVAIHPPTMKNLFGDLFQKIYHFQALFGQVEKTFTKTKDFWVGTAADKVRNTFMTKLDPQFSDLLEVLYKIHNNGMDWIEETIKFEASLNTP